jgi:hypothetical protein
LEPSNQNIKKDLAGLKAEIEKIKVPQKPRRKIFVEDINIPDFAASADLLSEVVHTKATLKIDPMGADKASTKIEKMGSTEDVDKNTSIKTEKMGSTEDVDKYASITKTISENILDKKTAKIRPVEEKTFETPRQSEIIRSGPDVESLTEAEAKIEKAKEAVQRPILPIKQSEVKHEISFKLKSNTLYEFEKIWQDLDHNSSQPIDFIKSLEQKQLQQVFKNSFEPKYLNAIIIGIERFYIQKSKTDILAILENIRQVPRFGMVLMFLDKDMKAALKRVCDRVGYKIKG